MANAGPGKNANSTVNVNPANTEMTLLTRKLLKAKSGPKQRTFTARLLLGKKHQAVNRRAITMVSHFL